MAVLIDTATSLPGFWGADPFGVDMNGFTSGNLAGGVQPTQLSADWFNATQQEINNAAMNGLGFALNSADYSQLAYSIDAQHIDRRPRAQTAVVYTFRSESNTELGSTVARTSLLRERTGFTSSLSAGTTTTVLALPTISNAIFLLEFMVTSVQTDLVTNYGAGVIRVAARNSAGVLIVDSTSTDYSYVPLAGWAMAVAVSGINVVLRVTIPAAPAGKVHNCFAHCRAINVVRV